MNDQLLIEIFGEENLENFVNQVALLDSQKNKLRELSDLRKRASDTYKVNITFPDIAIAAGSGILLGIGNALFKNFSHIKSINMISRDGIETREINWKKTFDSYKHKHEVTKTIIDHKSPQMLGMKLNDNLHRQIGPTHDIFRFKETLSLLTGNKSDYQIWGKTATRIIGHELSPLGQKFTQFMASGGFNIPADPAKELTNHLLIDFFTKTSIPIPGSTNIADSSPEMAKLMLGMYKHGFNFKNTMGNLLGYVLIQIILHGYIFLFKAIPQSKFSLQNLNFSSVKDLFSSYRFCVQKNEFHIQMIMAHGASFLADSLITVGTKNYAGLFQLNYMSLLAFCKHLLQYMIKGKKEYSSLMQQVEEKLVEIGKIDEAWFSNFRNNLAKNMSDSSFVSMFDIDKWNLQSLRINDFVTTTKTNLEKEDALIKELRK